MLPVSDESLSLCLLASVMAGGVLYIDTHTYSHTHTHARTHARTHAHTHTHTHAHTHTQISTLTVSFEALASSLLSCNLFVLSVGKVSPILQADIQ